MIPRWLLPVFFIILMVITLPVDAHVPISADNNNDLTTALSMEKPTKSYAIYGHLHDAGDVGYYKFSLNAGDRLTLSLMTTGFDAPVPDMIVMSPGTSGNIDGLSLPVTVPLGYNAEVIKGKKPVTAEYEPFSPAAIFNVASYSKNITQPGTYYVAVISPADETQYSIAVGYLEEFNLQEWVIVPINLIYTHLWEGQSIIAILAPFLAIFILGLILTARRERDNKIKKPLSSWLSTIAGLCYLGGASIVLVQMARVLRVTGPSAGVIITLIFTLIPILLGIWALRIARSPSPQSKKDRLSLGIIGLLGLLFWAGLIIGPVIAIISALVPEQYYHNSLN
ncbi:MAG: pre-peptidase C-terminal domain-containing protein [Methanoregula sp.]|nr:pre-peptidase C-terminal domain-containing protein [Methanoregula sp.]